MKENTRRRARRYGRKREEQRTDYPQCPLCEKPIRSLNTAITHKASQQPAHFDCVIGELRKIENLNPEERICYLGRGTFGVIATRNTSSPSRFLIKKRIQYEEKN